MEFVLLKKTQEEYNEMMEKSFKYLDEKSKIESWVIVVDGQRVMVNSGKQLWAKRNHAGSALRHHLSGVYRRVGGLPARTIQDSWIAEHVEIMTLNDFIDQYG